MFLGIEHRDCVTIGYADDSTVKFIRVCAAQRDGEA
jgi:Zn ribbon nucleic-acid-binding protein